MTIPPGVEHLAAQAVDLLRSHWTLAASPVADGALKEAGKSIFQFLKDRLTRPVAVEALAEMATTPEDQNNADAVRTQIKKEIAADPEFEKALRQLMEAVPVGVMETISQRSVQTGNDNKSAQVAGDGNQIYQAK